MLSSSWSSPYLPHESRKPLSFMEFPSISEAWHPLLIELLAFNKSPREMPKYTRESALSAPHKQAKPRCPSRNRPTPMMLGMMDFRS